MYIKDLIVLLSKHYVEEMKHADVLGEPEIMIDVFKQVPGSTHFTYGGIVHDVRVERSADGVYLILSKFSKDAK